MELTKEYFHVGTDHIYKELWLDIQMDQRHQLLKPYGGLWTSKLRTNCNRLCDWIDYLEEDNPTELERISYKKSCLVKFKENIKFLKIKDNNDFKNLKDSGFTIDISNQPINNITELLNYEKISDYFDLLYIDFFAHPSFNKFCVDTMLALKPDAIEYYKPIIVDYSNQQIKTVSNKKYITELNNSYYELLYYIDCIFDDIPFDGDYEKYITKLYNYKSKLIDIVKNNISNFDLPNEILNQTATTIIENLYREHYREKQKIKQV